MSDDRNVISVVFRDAEMPDEPGKMLDEPGVKAVAFLKSPITDDAFLQILGFLSQYCGGVSLWNGKMITPADKNETPPKDLH